MEINKLILELQKLLNAKLISQEIFDDLKKEIIQNYFVIDQKPIIIFNNIQTINQLFDEFKKLFESKLISEDTFKTLKSKTVETFFIVDKNSEIFTVSQNQSFSQTTNNVNNFQQKPNNVTINKHMLSMDPILEVRDLTKHYKKRPVPAISKLNFDIFPGQFHAFIGANGAGKTTTIKSIIGAYSSKNYSGKILIDKKDNSCADAKRLIGYIPERPVFPKKITTIDYLISMCMLSGYNKKESKNIAKNILKTLNLDGLSKKRPSTFSSGQAKKILLAQALIHKPKLLILDEPAANLDPAARLELFSLLLDLQKNGVSIFISSHILDEISLYATYVTILDGGQIVYSSPIEVNTDLKSLYTKFVKIGSMDTSKFYN